MRILLLLNVVTVSLVKGEKCFVPMLCNNVPTWSRVSMGREDGTCENQLKQLEERADHLADEMNQMVYKVKNLKNPKSTETPATVDNTTETVTNLTEAENGDNVRFPIQERADHFADETDQMVNKMKNLKNPKSTEIPTTVVDNTTVTVVNLTEAENGDNVKFPIQDSMLYDGKRYIALADYVDKTTAVTKCKNLGGELSNLYNRAHQDKIMDYIRQKKLNAAIRKDFHLGMTYDPIKHISILRNGTSVSNTEFNWYESYPRDGSAYQTRTNMAIAIHRDSLSVWQNLYNYDDSDSRHVLCEI